MGEKCTSKQTINTVKAKEEVKKKVLFKHFNTNTHSRDFTI